MGGVDVAHLRRLPGDLLEPASFEWEGGVMAKVVVLGAAGQIAGLAIRQLLEDETDELTLYLRNAKRVDDLQPDRVRVVEGLAPAG
jgi:hypothetical protein